jgi:hypothetical protein
MRGGAVAARRAHNPEVLGSNPSPATRKQSYIVGRFMKIKARRFSFDKNDNHPRSAEIPFFREIL